MNFRKLEIVGFKSFADKLEIIFEPGITAIVGPNGCGKSNIGDAIKWTLGEQNARALRCEKMEDIIFNGGSNRYPLGLSQVSLTISDVNGSMKTQYSDVEVERRLFRSGESEYYINRNRCLLKDIQELFMDTGLGINSYSIMEQGHIDMILNSNPQDRRLILEEAAGITKYRHRRRSALKKLEATEQNLLRINDILHELEQQVVSLKRQESRARTYQRYYDELKSLDITLSRRKYKIAKSELKNIETSIIELNDKFEKISTITTKTEAEIEECRLTITNLDARLSDIRSNERRIQVKIEETENNLAVLRERRAHIQQQQKKSNEEILRMTERINELERQISLLNEEREGLKKIILGLENELKSAQESVDELTKMAGLVEKNLDDLKSQAIDTLNKKAKIQNDISSANNMLEYLVNRHQRLRNNAESFRTEQLQLQENIEKLQNDIYVKEEEIDDLISRQNRIKSEIEDYRSKLAISEKMIKETEQIRNTSSAMLQSLQELQKTYEGYGAGVKEILIARDKKQIKGVCGVIAESLKTEQKYEIAIESALGRYLQCIVVESIEDARNAIKYLMEHKSGRAGFISMDMISSFISNRYSDQIKHDFAGIITSAMDVVEYEDAFSSLAKYLLGNTFITENLDVAIDLISSVQNSLGSSVNIQLVSLDGQVITSDGIITGGFGSESAGLLRRSREINNLKKEISEIDEQLNAKYKERDEIISGLSSLQQDKDKLSKEYQSAQIIHTGMQKDLSQLKQRLIRLEKEISVVNTEYESLNKEIINIEENKSKLAKTAEEIEKYGAEINKKIEEMQSEMKIKSSQRDFAMKQCTDIRIQLASQRQQEKNLNEKLKTLENERTQLNNTLSSYKVSAESDMETEKDVTSKISEDEKILEELFKERTIVKNEISELESLRQGYYNKLTKAETLIKDSRKDIDQIKQERYQLEVAKTQQEMNIGSIMSKLHERYGLREETEILSDESEQEMTDEELDNRINELRTKMERLGPVNLTAVDEYNKQKDRYDLMIAQKEDLLKAKESLYNIIQRINRESRERLKEVYESVNTNFQQFFQRLFGGGHGELILTDEGDILESGLEIIARPPGKKPQAISMLSTGERSLTAIALLFSLFKVKPSPFCILDEVDAALDDANIRRFTSMVKEFSSETQFIIITHNKRTMEIADVLYGITMEESGVSKLVSLKMNNKVSSSINN